ncbi:MAG TPA: SpoIIIAH-like family protein [Firmicutes bacterium]|jgi:stage III sporulation protein AH|nr:SpoIIIAH-like family protein [Bacillota bacterium]
MDRKKIWVFSIMLVAAVTYFFITGVEKEMTRIEMVPDEDMLQPILANNLNEDPSQWTFDDTHAFFVEYRLERDRVREQEMEMLNDMINNPQVGEEARREAEKQLLTLVEMMEKELIIENMLKAQGYADAILFTRKGVSTVMVHADALSEDDFLRVSEMVSAVTGVPREQVQVIQQN